MKQIGRWSSRLVGTLLFAASALAAHAQEIKLGFNGDLSASPSALVGQSSVAALQVAIDEVNAAGGVLGRKLVLVVRDDLSQPAKSIQNMVELIDNEKVSVVFGPTNSGNALAWRNIPNQKKVPVIVPMANATDITKPMSPGADNYIFRVSLVDRDSIVGLMAYASKNPKSKKIAYLAETTGYGQAGLKDIQEIGKLHGIEPVMIEKFGVNDTDMTSQLNKLKTAGVDTVVVWAQATPLGLLMRSMEKIDYYPVVLSGFATDQPPFLQAAGPKLIELPIFMRTIPGGPMSKGMQKLYDQISSKTTLGAPLIAQAAHSYDSVKLFALAVQQAGSVDGPKVKAALENLQRPYAGLMKNYVKPFSRAQHEALTAPDYHWIKWQNGQAIELNNDVIKSLTPADYKH